MRELLGCKVKTPRQVEECFLLWPPSRHPLRREAREALGALGDEVRLPVLPAASCGFHLKWGEDPGDAVAARAERPPAPHPGRPHRAQGLGGRGLEGAAGREAGDEPRADPGLAAGRGEVRPWSDSRAG
ncbi:uncharacterized protein LOC111167854 isoform X3 [Delphinapterus leucas]|uniref:Uncharacterized protein LOC111167854 isoform X3 n=1 Tax=Delphinapterus leucas TaxID=9749 RepID=A0A2Y9MCS8_DELLE|nr:uncharacterized protein LOC111167854 isoform X3 [Delphinapterus leucas]